MIDCIIQYRFGKADALQLSLNFIHGLFVCLVISDSLLKLLLQSLLQISQLAVGFFVVFGASPQTPELACEPHNSGIFCNRCRLFACEVYRPPFAYRVANAAGLL